MVNPNIFHLTQELVSEIKAAIVPYGFDDIPVLLESPKDKSHGDFSTPVAMLLAKKLKKSPLSLAQEIVQTLKTNENLVVEKKAVAPGFINFKLNPKVFYSFLESCIAQGQQYGKNRELKERKILLEFVSANPTGPLNVVNARAAVFGDSIAQLIKISGGSVDTEYYINDAGNQARLFGESLEAAIDRVEGRPKDAPEGGYQGAYMEDLAKEYMAAEGKKTRFNISSDQLGEWGMDQVVQWHKESLEHYGVVFDQWFSERRLLHNSGLVRETLEKLKGMGLTYEKDGATWIKTYEYGAHKDEVLVKSNGLPAYITADITYHLHKLKRGFTQIINIMGPDHHGHILSMKAAHQALGFPPEQFEVLVAQHVSLLLGGEKVKMSKREGKFVTMEELLGEVGRDAARFFFVMRGANSHLDFDLEVAKKHTEENPVFYIQYAHARICSLLKKCAEKELLPSNSNKELETLTEPEAFLLLKEIMEYPQWVVESGKAHEPHRIVVFLQTLAADFHLFYTKHRILDAPEETARARLALALGVKTVIRNALSLLGVSAPEQM
jgi:arginyl-tRNA synthetase